MKNNIPAKASSDQFLQTKWLNMTRIPADPQMEHVSGVDFVNVRGSLRSRHGIHFEGYIKSRCQAPQIFHREIPIDDLQLLEEVL